MSRRVSCGTARSWASSWTSDTSVRGKLRAVSLKAGSVRILLNQDDWAKGKDRVKGQGFSLQFTTAQSVDDIAKRITQRGGTLEKEPTDMPWGARIFSFRDPDGYKLVISSERAERQV